MKRKPYHNLILELYSLLAEKASEEEVVAAGNKFLGAKTTSELKGVIKSGPSGENNNSKFNTALKGTAGNIELKRQLYNALPPSPSNLPSKQKEQAATMPPFTPFIVRGKTPKGDISKGAVTWNVGDGKTINYPLPMQGGIGNGYNYASFREYLATLLSDESGEEKSAVKGGSPFAGDITQNLVQDPETGVWSNSETGEVIENPWFSWEPENIEEIFNDAKSTMGIVPGLSLRKIFYIITASPDAADKGATRSFKRELRGGYDPNVPVEAQKELYEGFRDMLGIISMIKTDEDGVKYIEKSRLKKSALGLLDSISYKKKDGLYIGHHASRTGRERMPYLYDMIDAVAANTSEDRSKGMTLAAGTEAIGDILTEVLIKSDDGTYAPAIRNPIFDRASAAQLKVISKGKESLIAGMMNHILGIDPENSDYMAVATEFRDTVAKINKIDEAITDGLPVGAGMLYGEDARGAMQTIMKISGVENFKDATLELIRQSFVEASIMSDLLTEAGVSVKSIGGINDVSKIGKREDFKVEFNDSSDHQKFNEYLQSQHGIELNIDKSLPISLKAYFGSSRDYSTGTTSMANSIQAFEAFEGNLNDETVEKGASTHNSFNDFMNGSKLFKSLSSSKRSEILSSKDKATKSMAVASKGVMAIMSSSRTAKGQNLIPLMNSYEDLLLDKDSGVAPSLAKEIMDDMRNVSKMRDMGKGDYKLKAKHSRAGAALMNGVRQKIGQNKEALRGLAYNDLISTVYTEEDEALVHSMYGNVRISGRHQIVSFLIEECEPEMNDKGGISWRLRSGDGRGKTMYRTLIREKGGSIIFDGRANPGLFSSVGKVFFKEEPSEMMEEGYLSRKEEVLGQLEKVLAKINEVFSV